MTQAAVDLLERDHEGISELFDRVSSPDEDRPGVLRVLVERLAAHIAVEQSVVLHELRKSGAHDSGLEEKLQFDYQVIQRNVVLIERRKANSPDMPELVAEMRDVFRAHIDRCQEKLYGDLERCLSEAQWADLAEHLQAADDVVMTHAHPHLLSLGPASRLMTRVAAGLDRLRGGAAWGGLATTSSDTSVAAKETPDPADGSVEPPPWRDPADG